MPRRRLSPFKIGVVGTINRDTIFLPDGTAVESWGGLLYSLKYLCNDGRAQIIPAVNVGADAYGSVMKILEGFDRIDLSHIRKVPEKNNHCFLHYHDQSHKCEILKGSVPPLTYGRIRALLKCDLVLVNFISGSDVTLAALERFRERFGGLVHMDIHSHTLGRRKVPGGYRRHLRRPPHWDRYIVCADVLQVNEIEFELLAGKPFSRRQAVDFFDRHAGRLTYLIVTLGAQGCLAVYRRQATISRLVPAIKVRGVVDTTGCGDIFGAAFAVEYLTTGNPLSAARNGNRLAGLRVGKRTKVF
jgi:sugar/nucleoside kinase (ribokinase family)